MPVRLSTSLTSPTSPAVRNRHCMVTALSLPEVFPPLRRSALESSPPVTAEPRPV